jgi:N-acetylglucosaminyldiphosphoundecaprenol N-acetyl-beta-D-mannosaminyltransferase
LLFGDGIGVYAASKILYGKNGLKQRVTGTDLYYHIFKYADECKLKCFFFGGCVEAVKLLPEAVKKKYPGIQITGALPRETEFKKETLDIIQKSNSDILFVGLGTPYQEEWIAKNFGSVKTCTLFFP